MRYIDPDERRGDRHATMSAFLPSEVDLRNPQNVHLSVNSTEVETIPEISDYFRTTQQNGHGEVALYVNKVQRFVDCGRKAGVQIVSQVDEPHWTFIGVNGPEGAFRHRPVQAQKTGRPGSPSHCGIEFIRAMNELQQRRFARELAKKPRFHIINKN